MLDIEHRSRQAHKKSNTSLELELSYLFNHYLSITPGLSEPILPKSDSDTELLFDMSPVMEGVDFTTDNGGTFYLTSKGAVRRFFAWCMAEPQTPEQGKAQMLVFEILMYQVLGSMVDNLRTVAGRRIQPH